jgi:hypothetical protein
VYRFGAVLRRMKTRVPSWIARRELQNIDQYISRGSDPAAVSFLQSTVKAFQAKIITEESPSLQSAMNPSFVAPSGESAGWSPHDFESL